MADFVKDHVILNSILVLCYSKQQQQQQNMIKHNVTSQKQNSKAGVLHLNAGFGFPLEVLLSLKNKLTLSN
jgi:hypothetical protein